MATSVAGKQANKRLKHFSHIIRALEEQIPAFPELKDQVVLELGPGHNLNLLRYIRDYSIPKMVQGIGLSKKSFWQKKISENDQELILDSLILPALKSKKARSVDIIISRHVLEQHSIEAAILYKDPAYKIAIQNDQFENLPESFPASIKNIQAIFGECYRILKPGGKRWTPKTGQWLRCELLTNISPQGGHHDKAQTT